MGIHHEHCERTKKLFHALAVVGLDIHLNQVPVKAAKPLHEVAMLLIQ